MTWITSPLVSGFAVICMAIGLAGCGGSSPPPVSTGSIARPGPASAVPAQGSGSGSEYHLGVGDRVKIVVFGQADLTNETEVDASGKITMALIGDIPASGRTARELETEIRTRLDKDFLVNPKVSLLIVAYRPITVLGQVKNPGRYPFAAGMDIRQAIAVAGGYDRRGSTSSATIYRNNQEMEVPPETLVQPGDTIEIPRRFF